MSKRDRDLGLALVVIYDADGEHVFPDAVGCYIGPSTPIEVEQGVSWRDALADEMAKVAALEAALESLGYEVAHFHDVVELKRTYPDVQNLIVNGEPWDLED